MCQQVQSWRSLERSRLWLAMLLRAMEDVSRPDVRRIPCEEKDLTAVKAKLAVPSSSYRSDVGSNSAPQN
jgi:hypothetical protein